MKLYSDYALLDVKHGRRQLDRLIEKAGKGHYLPGAIMRANCEFATVPNCIYALWAAWGTRGT